MLRGRIVVITVIYKRRFNEMAFEKNNELKSDELAFKKLVETPDFAWPTALMMIVCLSLCSAVAYLAVTVALPLWAGALINGIVVYFLFSVVHDSSHGSISKNKALNDWFGRVGMLFFGPIATLDLARWIHMQHHRFTNDPVRDPDHFGHKMDWLTPLRWANFDYFYTAYFLKHAGPMRKKLLPRLIVQVGFVIVVTVLAMVLGYGAEVWMLWLLPTRISSILFVTMFVYLPHAPFARLSEEGEYQASNIRAGYESILTPLMAYQNYHLVHHLYPRAPFYRMVKIWNARKEYHVSQNPFFVKTFSVGKKVAVPE